jgi:gluconokinase
MTQEQPLFSTSRSVSASPLVVALDLGTSSVRAILFDAQGVKIGQAAQRHYTQSTTPDGGVETDVDALFQLVLQCLDDVVKQTPGSIIAVAASCFWHSLMAMDEKGQALSPLYSWADNRAAPWVPALRAILPESETHARTGCVFHPSYWPAKLLWLHHTQPQWFDSSTRWISFGEYIAQRLFGRAQVSLSMASGTGFFHQESCDWDEETLAALPITRDNLSPLCDADEYLGELLPPWKTRWPQLAEARWFPAIGDGACSNLGSGCTDASRMALNVGTSGALRVVLRADEFAGAAPRVCGVIASTAKTS